MKLVSPQITSFRSVDDSGNIEIRDVTCFCWQERPVSKAGGVTTTKKGLNEHLAD